MGSYKVPQNVEAEDKILGPLSLKQFIYALIGLAWGGFTFVLLKSIIVLWVLIGLPPMLALVGLGLYQKEDQPLETYVIAIAQFFVRPKGRIWQKEPISEVFHLEPPPPKPEEFHRDPRQVRSQLSQLADLVDTRGWSSKEPEVQEPDELPVIDLQDRIGGSGLTRPTFVDTMTPVVSQDDDMLNNSSISSQALNVLMENSTRSIREEAREKMRLPQPVVANAVNAAVTTSQQTDSATPSQTSAENISGSTVVPSGAILKLAREGGDLTVAQIAAQARKSTILAEGQTVSLR